MPLSLRLTLLLAAGIAAGLQCEPGAARLLAMTAAGFAAAAVLARRSGPRLLVRASRALACGALAAMYGLHAATVAEHGPLRQWFDMRVAERGGDTGALRLEDPVRLRGRLARDASVDEDGARIQVAVTSVSAGRGWLPVRGGVSLTVGGASAARRASQWRAGRAIEVPAMLRRPARYLNDGVPDGERAMARRGTVLVGSVKSAALVEVCEAGAWWDEAAAEVRAAVRAAMAHHVGGLDGTSAAIATAILIGDRASLSPEVERRLQEAGTYHVVAISGGNIALLASAVLAALWAAGIRFEGAALTAMAVLVAHAWVIGGGASVVRATVMAVVYLALRLIDQRTSPVHAVAVGATVMLLAQPLEVVDAGFWLTFGATGALLAAATRLGRPPRPRWWHAPAAICLGSLAVELVLAPVSALVFERVTLAGLGLNLVAVPAMAVVQGAASLCVLADACGLGPVATAAGYVTHIAARALVDSSRFVEWMPWATWRVPPPRLALVGTYYLVLAGWWRLGSASVDCASHRRFEPAARLAAVAIWGWIVMSPASLPLPADGRLRVAALDVGQGDAVLVICPDGTTLLVDTGGLSGSSRFDIGDRVVGPALRARGVRRLDYLAITHADADHAGGAVSVVRDFRPREVWVGVPVPSNPTERALREAAVAARSAWRWLRRGQRLAFGDVELRVHHPPDPDWERRNVRNDDSLVLELRLGEMSVVLTGDVTREVEHELARVIEPHRTVVLKAPHHGSATSSSPALLDHLTPAVVLVSAGRGNPFGHPAPAVLARYRARGAAVFRTDADGRIDVATDGRSLTVTTFTGRTWRLR